MESTVRHEFNEDGDLILTIPREILSKMIASQVLKSSFKDDTNLDSVISNFLDEINVGKVVIRDRYATFKGILEGKNKSSLYYYLYRNKILNLSIHNNILDNHLTSFLFADYTGVRWQSKFYYVVDPIGLDEYIDEYTGRQEKLSKQTLDFLHSSGYSDYRDWIYSPPVFAQTSEKNILLLPTYDEEALKKSISCTTKDINHYAFNEQKYSCGPPEILLLEELKKHTHELGHPVPSKSSSKGRFIPASVEILPVIKYEKFFNEMPENIAIEAIDDDRFHGTKRLKFSDHKILELFLDDIESSLIKFLT